MSGPCCAEYGCKRKHPYKIRLTPFGRRWVLITRYTLNGSLLTAHEKHDVHDELVAALLDAGWTPPTETPREADG